ncbi:protein terminus [Drosophila innubila]|uniref:protein terminus n=1 Tax=Drosophila innubila TaxID=198719 RepID=UPI00148CD592|nr:protein terminus [Drosophila innubila]
MSRHRQSRFIFETSENVRTFRHQPFISELSVECQSCQSRVRANEPYSHHWMSSEDGQHIKLSLEEKLLLKRIERERVDTFIMCDESAVGRTRDFLLDAGMEAVPQLLRFLNYEASQLEVTFGFYVNVTKKRLYYETFPIIIKHFLDIDETVDMVFTRMVEKISSYVLSTLRVPMEACTIKRLKLIVHRQFNSHLQLPLQYRVKSDVRVKATKIAKPVDLPLLTESYINYHGKRFGHFPDSLQVNLYCFRVCPRTKELYAVPYLIRSEDVNNTPTFLIQTDVAGEFRGMHEIRNVRRFLRSDPNDRVLVCRQCKAHFSSRLHFALHKYVDCGRGIVVMSLDMDTDGESTEVYENCFSLPKQFFKFAWFAIGPN